MNYFKDSFLVEHSAWTSHTGRISNNGYNHCVDNLKEFIISQGKEHNISFINNLEFK